MARPLTIIGGDLASRLGCWRRVRGYTRQQLADRSRVSYCTIYRIERRITTNVNASTLNLLAAALDADLGQQEGPAMEVARRVVADGQSPH